MTEQEKIDKIIQLISVSDLDQTIKDIIIRDLKAEGLTEFLREQILAYCLEGIKKDTSELEEAKQLLIKHKDNLQPN